jgi:hypothetical protein
MRSIIILCLLACLVIGCSMMKATVPIVLSNGEVDYVKLEYWRLWNQSIDEFYLKTPSNWEVCFGGMDSSNKLSAGYGPIKIEAGGSSE